MFCSFGHVICDSRWPPMHQIAMWEGRAHLPSISPKSLQGRCLLLLLRIRSAHLEILGFPADFLSVVLINTGIFYAEKAVLSKCSWYPKRKLGVTTHFSEIIKLEFAKKTPYIALYFKDFYK